jgi:hypothetical protein
MVAADWTASGCGFAGVRCVRGDVLDREGAEEIFENSGSDGSSLTTNAVAVWGGEISEGDFSFWNSFHALSSSSCRSAKAGTSSAVAEKGYSKAAETSSDTDELSDL